MTTKKCKACGIDKQREFSHLNSQARKVYKDANGNLWMGNLCPDCNCLRVKAILAAKKLAKSST